jgi:hypothetical protein
MVGSLSTLTVLLALGGLESAAQAQGAPPVNDSVTVVARQRYTEGVAAFDAGRYEDARAAFLQAYALKRHPAVLLNLGQSELRSGHHEDAGNHLQQFLREHAGATADDRATAERGIAEAKKKAGFVIVIIDASGADVNMDGTTIGRSPLLDPVFVKPGKHTFYATFQGRSAAAAVDAKAGSATTATLTLGVQGSAPPPVAPPPVAPPPVAPPPVAPPPVAPPPGPPVYPPGAGPGAGPGPGVGPGPGMGPTPERMTFGQWYAHKPLAWVGTAAAGVGAIMGIWGGSSALSWSNSSKNHVDQINKENMTHPEFNPDGRKNLCGDANGVGALPHYGTPVPGQEFSACQLVQKDIANYHTALAVTGVGWTLFGLGVITTGVYAYLDYGRKGSAQAAPSSGPRVMVLPVPLVSPEIKGFGLVGSF